MTTIQFFYWCNVLDAWVQCTQDEYMRTHYGKSYTRIQEIDNDQLGLGHRGAGNLGDRGDPADRVLQGTGAGR